MQLKHILYSFIAGFVGIFAFAPFSIKILIFLSYGYLAHVIINQSKHQFAQVFSWGLGHWGFGMSWIIVSVYYYGETSILMSSLIHVLLTIILTLVFTCPLLLLILLKKYINQESNSLKILFVASFFMISEISREYLLNGVPWLIPGNIYLDTIGQNIYSYLGASFASYVIYLLTTALVILGRNNKIPIANLVIVLFILIPQNNDTVSEGDILVSIIQPSSDPFLKYKDNYYLDIESNLLSLIKNTSEDTNLIVIPEAELPYPINDMRFSKFIDRTNSANKILLGAWFFNDAKLFNTIYNPENKNIYKKQHLVPFGEYIPFFSSLRGLISFFDLPMSNVAFGPNDQNNIIVLDNVNVATPICFDVAFPETIRKMNKSSFLMINISNDTWFGSSIGPYHHLSITRVRAIENNRWIIRATNNGFSAIIDNKGTIVEILDQNVSNVLESKVKLVENASIFNKFGYMFNYFFSFIIILLFIAKALWIKLKN